MASRSTLTLAFFAGKRVGERVRERGEIGEEGGGGECDFRMLWCVRVATACFLLGGPAASRSCPAPLCFMLCVGGRDVCYGVCWELSSSRGCRLIVLFLRRENHG